MNFDFDLSQGKEPIQNQENTALKYFMDFTAKIPSIDEIKNEWPISNHAFIIGYHHIPKNPGALAPNKTKQIETHTDYYVSPRKLIRFIENKGIDYMYSDSFVMQGLITLTHLDAPGQSPPFNVEFDIKWRWQ